MNTQSTFDGDIEAPKDMIEETVNIIEQAPPEMSEQSVEEVNDETTPEQLDHLRSMRARRGRGTGRSKAGVVRLSKKRQDEALAPGITNIGNETFHIPELSEQLKGFEVHNAGRLVAQFKQYKFVEDKGRPKTQNVQI